MISNQAMFKTGIGQPPILEDPEKGEPFSPSLHDFIQKVLTIDHEQRPSAEELLQVCFNFEFEKEIN